VPVAHVPEDITVVQVPVQQLKAVQRIGLPAGHTQPGNDPQVATSTLLAFGRLMLQAACRSTGVAHAGIIKSVEVLLR
jgi:hypothetical protein